MIGLVAIATAFTALAVLGLHLLPPLARRILTVLGLPLGYYVLFVMPAGGADNPLPIPIAVMCFAVTLGGIILEVANLFRKRNAKVIGANG